MSSSNGTVSILLIVHIECYLRLNPLRVDASGAAGYTVNANMPMVTVQPMRQVNDGRDGVGEGEGDLLGL